MSARPSRLSKNRHGTFCLRWVVPARYRDATGAPKEVRFSLRTNDPHKARILALEFNLALERMHGMTNDFDLSRMTAPWTLKTDSFAVEVKDDKDQRLFTKFLKENPDIREKLVASIRSGVDPTEALKALLASVKDAIGGAVSAVSQPMHLKEAVRLYVASLPALSKNRGTTVWEKQRSLDQLAEHLQAAGHDVEKIRVHEILRPLILDFIQTYAARKSKEEKRNEKADSEGVARAQQGLDDLKNDIKGAGLSSRTILKKVGNLNDFFTFACGRGWVTSNPIDESFMKSMRQLKIKAGKAKTSNHYDGFKPDDIRKIFDAKDYLDVNRKADYFWGPLISLHTGARLGEIATLTPHRIQYEKEADLHVFLMGRKNENSVRKVPIAQNLIDIGLLDYWQWTLHNDAKFLFPHQPKTETQGETVGKNLTRNFSEYLKKIKIKKDAKVFQSFRHTLVTKMHVKNVPIGDAMLIVGHAAQDGEERMSHSSDRQSGHPSNVHLDTYVHAEDFEEENQTYLMRLKAHIDKTLVYPINVSELRVAAQIILEHCTASTVGGAKKFKSGWHTNNKKYSELIRKHLVDSILDKIPETP